MPSAVAKGQYYQHRTRQWLEAQGYVVATLERMQSIPAKTGGFVFVKHDQWGGDLIAMSPERTWIVQVKGGEFGQRRVAAARAEFAKYPLGPGCQQVIVCWAPRAREPDVVIVATGPQPAPHPVIVPPRRQPKILPLFATR